MVARAHHEPSHGFEVVLERNGREHEREVCLTGERALKVALLMLAKLDDLRDGDRLTCTETTR